MQIKAKYALPLLHNEIIGDQHLTLGREYLVIGISDEYYRVVNDQHEPILYPKVWFQVENSNVPTHWIRRDYDDGEYHIDPPELASRFFFEDYFDGKPEAIKKYNRYLKLQGAKRE